MILSFKMDFISFEKYLISLIDEMDIISDDLKSAMKYSVSRGGKRLRPKFSLLTAAAFDIEPEVVYPYAAALEMIHEFSLIHDDLPCMDNDDFRRGKETTHVIYGEMNALLSGDALLNLAAEISFNDLLKNNDINKVWAYKFLFNKSGALGMIGGQAFENEANDSVEDYYKTIDGKTVALFECSIYGTGLYLGLDKSKLELLAELSINIGQGFQAIDDRSDKDGIYKISKEKCCNIINSCKINIDSLYKSLSELEASINGYKDITDVLFSKEFINN